MGRDGCGCGVELSSTPSIGVGGGESTRTVGIAAADVADDDPVTLAPAAVLDFDVVEALEVVVVADLDVAGSLLGVEVVEASTVADDS